MAKAKKEKIAEERTSASSGLYHRHFVDGLYLLHDWLDYPCISVYYKGNLHG